MNTVRFIEKTIAELEAISRNDVNRNRNSVNNAFVYDTNSKNFVINHVTQSLIPASQRINVGKVPYDVRGLRKLIDAGYIKAPHAPSENLANDVVNEVNRRTGVEGGSVGKLIFRTKRAKDNILKILKESARDAQGNTEKRLVDDFFQLVVLAVNATSNFYMVSPLVPTSSKFEVPRRYSKHFQIGTRIPSTGFELIADVHGAIDPDDGTFDYLYYTNWIVVHPKFKIAFEHPFEDTETLIVKIPKTKIDAPHMEKVLQSVLVPAFDILTDD